MINISPTLSTVVARSLRRVGLVHVWFTDADQRLAFAKSVDATDAAKQRVAGNLKRRDPDRNIWTRASDGSTDIDRHGVSVSYFVKGK